MIQKFVDRFMKRKDILREMFSAKHPDNYKEVVTTVIKVIAERDGDNKYQDTKYKDLQADMIVEIDHGSYQGTLLYLIPDNDYQPHDYYYVKVLYGTCSGCDTLQSIKESHYGAPLPTNNQVDQYMTLALHIVQNLKKLDGDSV